MIQVTVEKDEDSGTLVFRPGKDDSFLVHGHGGDVRIEVPLYSHEAAHLIELLKPLAEWEST